MTLTREERKRLAEEGVVAKARLDKLVEHPCCHPPKCGHARFSECRNALVKAIFGLDESTGGTP